MTCSARMDMINNFKTELVVRLAALNEADVLKGMGYRTPTARHHQRLQQVLDDPEFGLASGAFDFRYSSEEFLKALCAAVGVQPVHIDQQIARIQARLEEERQAFKPYLWVDTGFRRTSQPIYALAVCEPQRYLHFPQGFWRYSIEQQLNLAQRRVKQHVAETYGNLGIWGEIKQYRFYYKNDAAYLLARDGSVMGEHQGSPTTQRSLHQDLALVVSQQ